MQRSVVRRLQDVVIAVVLGVVAVFETQVPFSTVLGSGSPSLTLAVSLCSCAALVVRRTHPLVAALVVLLGLPAVYSITPLMILFYGQFVPIVIVLYSVARYATSRRGIIGGLAGMVTLLYLDLEVQVLENPGEIVFHWTICVVAWSLGRFVRAHAQRAERETARAVTAELSGREKALQAVADERARIARELHDIIAHSVSVMVVQAGAAEKALDDPDFVRSALGSIRTTGTSALAEMRRVVSLIRDDDQPTDLQPQPDLEALEGLVAAMDVPTRLLVEGDERPLSAGVALSAYRIVQEALTNVRRHSQAETAQVHLRYGTDSLEIEVSDDGRGAVAATGGNGLIGMRERVQMYGGTLATTSVPGEGFRVRAVIPMATT